MKVQITSPGEHDRRDHVVRFQATLDGRPTSFMLDDYAAFIMSEALDLGPTPPLKVYHVSGNLLVKVVEQTVAAGGAERLDCYLITCENVLEVTGRSGEGVSDVPKKWDRSRR